MCLCILGIRIKIRKKIVDARLYHNLPINGKKIVFRSTLRGYSCNPKYIAEEIIRRNLDCELVWVTDAHVLKYLDSFPTNLKLVMGGTDDALREYSTAKIWIENERRNPYVAKGHFKREGQTYIQTWHGTFGLKTIGRARKNTTRATVNLSEVDSKQIDYLISNSFWETGSFKNAFSNNGAILEYGHPRNDILFQKEKHELIRNKIYEKYGIPKNKKLLLYVPTWREDGDLKCFSMDYASIQSAFEKRFGGEWVIAARLHYLMLDKRHVFLPPVTEVYNVTEHPDIQELITAADACVSDYSSSILDFVLTRRPGFIYAADREKFERMRGLWYPLSETPFPVAEDNDVMVKNIENFDEEAYKARVEEFLKGKGCIEDGHAAERVVDLIESIINSNNNKTL